MLVYVNGDGHAAAAEAVNQYKTASEDANVIHLGKLPHPENLSVSYGKLLSLALRAGLLCEAYNNNTVTNIIQSTKKYVEDKNTDLLVIIQWPDNNEDDKIYELHTYLNSLNIKHIFFNSEKPLSTTFDYGINYIQDSYTSKIQSNNIQTVSPNSPYFGKDGHAFWNRFLIKYIINNKFI